MLDYVNQDHLSETLRTEERFDISFVGVHYVVFVDRNIAGKSAMRCHFDIRGNSISVANSMSDLEAPEIQETSNRHYHVLLQVCRR